MLTLVIGLIIGVPIGAFLSFRARDALIPNGHLVLDTSNPDKKVITLELKDDPDDIKEGNIFILKAVPASVE